jgi:transcriptional regulator with XRE-family HTH domain
MRGCQQFVAPCDHLVADGKRGEDEVTQPEFGRRLRAQREKRGLSQTDLTDAGVSKSYLSLLESGQRQPSPKVVLRLAERLGVDVEYLLSGQDQATRQERDLRLRFAELALRNGDPREARTTLEELHRSRGADDPARFQIEHALALAHERCGDLEAAIELLEELRERGAVDPGRWPWLQVLIDLSRCYREAGDVHRAVEVAERGVEKARELGLNEARDYPRLVVTLAGASRERGDHAHAAQLLRRLLDQLGAGATRKDRGSALWNAAVVAAERGQHADAILLAERALAQFAEEDDTRAQGLLRTTLAWMLLDAGEDPKVALGLLEDAHRRLVDAGMQIESAYTETELARAHTALGSIEDALSWARQSLERLGGRDRLETARARLALARALLANDEHAAAVLELSGAAEAMQDLSMNRQAAATWSELAELYAESGDLAAAHQANRRALEALGLVGRRPAERREPRPSTPADATARADR